MPQLTRLGRGLSRNPYVDPIYSDLPSKIEERPIEAPPAELPLGDSRAGRPSLSTDISSGIPRGQTRLEELQGQYAKIGQQPDTLKGRLLQIAGRLAPTAIAGAIGGTYAASGAAQGTSEALDIQREQENLQRKSLLQEMENERQRQEREAEHELAARVAEQGHEERLKGIEETVAGRKDVADILGQSRRDVAGTNAAVRSLGDELRNITQNRGLDIRENELKNLDDYRNAQKELAAARTALVQAQADPNSPQFKLAQQRVAVAQSNHDTAAQRLGLSEKQFEMRAHGTEGGEPLPGSLQTDLGQTVGTAFQQNVRPTGQERNKADLANSAHDQIADLKDIVKRRQDIFGPVAGRKTDFAVWVGSQDPDAQRFRAARTIAGDHLAGVFGGRSEAALQALDAAIGQFKDNPEAVLAGLDQLDKANVRFVQAGTPRTTGSKAGGGKKGTYNPKTGKVEY